MVYAEGRVSVFFSAAMDTLEIMKSDKSLVGK